MRMMYLRSPGKLSIEIPVSWRTLLAKPWANHSFNKLQPSTLRLDNFTTSDENFVRPCPLVVFINEENCVCARYSWLTPFSTWMALSFFYFSTNRAKWDQMGKNWYPKSLQKWMDMDLWLPHLLPLVRGFSYFFCCERTATALILVLCLFNPEVSLLV